MFAMRLILFALLGTYLILIIGCAPPPVPQPQPPKLLSPEPTTRPTEQVANTTIIRLDHPLDDPDKSTAIKIDENVEPKTNVTVEILREGPAPSPNANVYLSMHGIRAKVDGAVTVKLLNQDTGQVGFVSARILNNDTIEIRKTTTQPAVIIQETNPPPPPKEQLTAGTPAGDKRPETTKVDPTPDKRDYLSFILFLIIWWGVLPAAVTIFINKDLRRELFSPTKPSCILRIYRHGRSPKNVKVFDDGVIIGRSLRCGIILSDTRVSKQHALLTIVKGTPHIKDLGSSNGTSVNGKRITESSLNVGDSICLGRVTLEVIQIGDNHVERN